MWNLRVKRRRNVSSLMKNCCLNPMFKKNSENVRQFIHEKTTFAISFVDRGLLLYLELLRAGDLLALLDHVGEPVGPPVQVEDEAEGGVSHLLHPVPRDIAHRDTHLPRSLQHGRELNTHTN